MNEEQRRELLNAYETLGEAIRTRLHEFRTLPQHKYFYELCYCLMTPQSSALHCAAVAEELERRNFHDVEFDPAQLLRQHRGAYVRFHNVKARRLLEAREKFGTIAAILHSRQNDKDVRDNLVDEVAGLGMKEASHFLRNIGRTGVCILDRHILRNLVSLGAMNELPTSISRKRYRVIETMFEQLADDLRIPADEFDLLLWYRETGFVFK